MNDEQETKHASGAPARTPGWAAKLENSMTIKCWRFCVEDFNGRTTYLDADGEPNGDTVAAEFIGTSAQACDEGDRRADVWEAKTGNDVAKITRESRGVPNGEVRGASPEGEASSAEGATSTVVLGATDHGGNDEQA